MSNPNANPEGFHTLTPFVYMTDIARAIDFYQKVFGAIEIEREEAEPGGRVTHAHLRFGDSPMLISDPTAPHAAEHAQKGWARSPQALGGSPVHFYIYVDDVDEVFKRAIAAGATLILPVKDQEWGDRTGGLQDPAGHVWYIATRR
jgi:PhnB protein